MPNHPRDTSTAHDAYAAKSALLQPEWSGYDAHFRLYATVLREIADRFEKRYEESDSYLSPVSRAEINAVARKFWKTVDERDLTQAEIAQALTEALYVLTGGLVAKERANTSREPNVTS